MDRASTINFNFIVACFPPSASSAYKGPIHGAPKLNNDLHVPPNNNEASHTNQLCFSSLFVVYTFFQTLLKLNKYIC